jgi:glutathione S-transferase
MRVYRYRGGVTSDGKPVLWHIPVSHYNEKARWALAYKGVEHERRAPTPPLHMLVALYLTRGRQKTFPVLELHGKRIGDSTAIVAALESRFPDPPLYPQDDSERRRALELEDWFDEQLGPQIRLLAWHELTRDRERLERFASGQVPGPLARVGGLGARATSAFVGVRFGVKSEHAAELARRKVLEALDRLEAELGGGEYLVGDRFSVADLTAAALFYPLVLPPEGPRIIADPPEGFESFRAPLKDRPGYGWVEDMFRRHRRRQEAPARV